MLSSPSYPLFEEITHQSQEALHRTFCSRQVSETLRRQTKKGNEWHYIGAESLGSANVLGIGCGVMLMDNGESGVGCGVASMRPGRRTAM